MHSFRHSCIRCNPGFRAKPPMTRLGSGETAALVPEQLAFESLTLGTLGVMAMAQSGPLATAGEQRLSAEALSYR